MSRILAVAPALPSHVYTQAEITAELSDIITDDRSKRAVMSRFHAAAGIGHRHTVLPLEEYRDLRTFQQANDLWISEGTALAARAVTTALATAGIGADQVDYLLFTSVTGMAAPSIDARLVPILGLRPNVKRMPSFGLSVFARVRLPPSGCRHLPRCAEEGFHAAAADSSFPCEAGEGADCRRRSACEQRSWPGGRAPGWRESGGRGRS